METNPVWIAAAESRVDARPIDQEDVEVGWREGKIVHSQERRPARFGFQALQEFWIRTDHSTGIFFPSHLLGAVVSSSPALKTALVLSGSTAEGSFTVRRYM